LPVTGNKKTAALLRGAAVGLYAARDLTAACLSQATSSSILKNRQRPNFVGRGNVLSRFKILSNHICETPP
jgi:hypothetical protein